MLKRPSKHLRSKLLVSMFAVIFLLTAAVLSLVQARMRQHVREDLVSDLKSESAFYLEIENVRREQALQSVALLANQPSLKALMSTNDKPTVQDASESILHTSKADLLILENSSGEILALQSSSPIKSAPVFESLMQQSNHDMDWWFANGKLYDVSFAPILAGAGGNNHLLGRIALGREVSPRRLNSSPALRNSDSAFVSQGEVILSSLPADLQEDLGFALAGKEGSSDPVREIKLGSERYLASAVELKGDHPVTLLSLKSYDQATSFLNSLNDLLLTLGSVATLVGAFIAFMLARQVTRPLERLVLSARKLEKGDFDFQMPIEGSGDEVTDLTRAFEEMRKSLLQSREGLMRSARMEAVGRLAGGVAHDFNNLVMIIKGYSDLLLDSARAEDRQYLEEIKKAGERASALTRQLLAFSRKQVLEPQILDPNQTVKSITKMLRVLIGEDIELVTNFTEPVGKLQVDPGQLEQVVMNLAVNARDAMPQGGKLVIETQTSYLDENYAKNLGDLSAGSFIVIAVTDTGCGMSKETLTHIFEPFFTTKEPGKGTGLGLATVYGIVKQSRGHVSVYSEPGVGTTFKVYLPALDKAVPVSQTALVQAAPRGNGTILLVEDEPSLRSLASESLRRLGYSVLQASHGVEGLAVAEKHAGPIDVVITDIVMPRMGGPEMVKNLRNTRAEFAVIFMSGYTETAAIENSGIGADATLLNKPFSMEALASKIAAIRTRPAEAAKAFAAAASR